MHGWMKSISIALIFGLLSTAHASAQDWTVVEGTKTAPSVSGSVKPKVTKRAPGVYLLEFARPVGFFIASSQTAGTGGDTTHTVVSSVQDSSDPRKIYVTVFTLAPDSPVGDPIDARISILVRAD